MHAILFFRTVKEAREYRHEHGTGGFIFAPDPPEEGMVRNRDLSDVLLFPPDFYPNRIFHHPLTKGRSGTLEPGS